MSKIRNTPHVYTPPLKRLHIKWYPGNDDGCSWHRAVIDSTGKAQSAPAPRKRPGA